MRELTFDEMDLISGAGSTATQYEIQAGVTIINVTPNPTFNSVKALNNNGGFAIDTQIGNSIVTTQVFANGNAIAWDSVANVSGTCAVLFGGVAGVTAAFGVTAPISVPAAAVASTCAATTTFAKVMDFLDHQEPATGMVNGKK